MKQALKYHIVLMLVSPMFGLYYAIKASNPLYKKWMLVFFITLFGSTIQFAPGADATTHQEHVNTHYYSLPFSEFLDELEDILLLQPQRDTNDDVYIHILSFLCGSLLGVPGLFFVFVSFVYGYFYVSGMLKVFQYVNFKQKSWLVWGFILLFIFYKSIDNINTVRTWTGLWVLFNGAFGYFLTKKRKYLLLVAATPLIHIGYAALALPTAVVCLFKVRPFLYVGIFAASFTTQAVPIGIINQLSSTQLGASKVKYYYTDPESNIDRSDSMSSKNWYVYYGKHIAPVWGTNFLAGLLLITGVFFYHMNKQEQLLFSVCLLTVAMANFNYFLYALYNRGYAIAGLFAIATILLLLSRNKKVFKNHILRKVFHTCIVVSIGVYSITGIFVLSNLLSFVSAFMIGLPFVPWFVNGINLSLREFIGEIAGI